MSSGEGEGVRECKSSRLVGRIGLVGDNDELQGMGTKVCACVRTPGTAKIYLNFSEFLWTEWWSLEPVVQTLAASLSNCRLNILICIKISLTNGIASRLLVMKGNVLAMEICLFRMKIVI